MSPPRAALWAACLTTGCAGYPDEVLLSGTVLDGPEGQPLADARLVSLAEDGTEHGDTSSTGDGGFELLAPAGDVVFVDVVAPGFATASHTGVAALADTQRVEPGTIFGFPDAQLDEWRALFAGCPGSDGADGVALGEVRVSDIVEAGTDIHPLVETAVLTLDDGRGNTWEACYLAEDGLAYDPDAQWTGDSGRFAIFGVPEGEYRLTVEVEIVEDIWSAQEYPARVPAGGVAPRFPVWTEFTF